MSDQAAASAAQRFYISPDNKLVDRILGCESRVRVVNTDPPELVSLSDMLGWLNKLDEERVAASARAKELQERLDVNAESPQSIEGMQRKLDDLRKTFDLRNEAYRRLELERDEAKRAYSVAALEIATLAGAQRELNRLRGVHAAFVKGARELLGQEKANLLEAECDIPEHFNEDAVAVANAARLPRNAAGDSPFAVREQQAANSEQPPSAQEAVAAMQADAEKLPPVENDPADAILAERRQTIDTILKNLAVRFDRFQKLAETLKMGPSGRRRSREAVFHAASGAIFGMVCMFVREFSVEVLAMRPEDTLAKAAGEIQRRVMGLMGALAWL
jgi:hypothetical protein